MLKPTDKVSFGLMSKLPGCNVSERPHASPLRVLCAFGERRVPRSERGRVSKLP